MPRYYLHILTGSETIKDVEGIDLPDLEAARVEVERVCRELVDEIIDPTAEM